MRTLRISKNSWSPFTIVMKQGILNYQGVVSAMQFVAKRGNLYDGETVISKTLGNGIIASTTKGVYCLLFNPTDTASLLQTREVLVWYLNFTDSQSRLIPLGAGYLIVNQENVNAAA